MVRFRKRASLGNIVNSIKHYVPQTDTPVLSGGKVNVIIANAVVAPAASAVTEVTQGSIIKAFWIELWLLSDNASQVCHTFTITVEKSPVGFGSPTFTNMLNLSSYTNKKNILYTTQGLISSGVDQGSLNVIRQFFMVPKGKQRMGLGDRLIYTVANTAGLELRICGMSIFKEYR